MKLVLLSLAVVGCGCWKLPAIPSGQRSQYYTQQSDGSYKFGFDSTQGLYHVQQADGSNEVQGSFGTPRDRVHYTAGVGGFKVVSTDHSGEVQHIYHHENQVQQQEHQVEHEEEEEQEVSDAAVGVAAVELPQQVEDTAEVAEAKRRFHVAYNMAAQAAEDAADINIINSEASSSANHNQHHQIYFSTGSHQASASSSSAGDATLDQLLTHPVQVEDTEAVSIAKAKFHQAYAAAAQAAASAPDTDIITADSSDSSSAAVSDQHTHSAVHDMESSMNENTMSGSMINSLHNSAAAGHHKYSMVHSVEKKPEATIEQLLTHPVQVEDTAEVAHAKKEFQKAYEAAAQAAAAAPDINIISAEVNQQESETNQVGDDQAAAVVASISNSDSASGEHHTNSAIIQHATLDQLLTLPVQVEDTAEVARAKVEFHNAYKAAAAAAESAPDTNVIVAEISQAADSNAASGGHTSMAEISASSDTAAAGSHIQHATLEQLLTHPVQVEDTEEVARAKAEFFRLYAAAAAAADAAPDVNIVMKVSTPVVQAAMSSHNADSAMAQLHTMNTRPNIRFATLEELLTLPKPVEDTDEVKQAKIAFHAAYKAAAANAEAAEGLDVVSDTVEEQAQVLNTEEEAGPVINTAYSMESNNMMQNDLTSAQSDSSDSSNEAAQILSLTSNHMDDGSYQFAYETEDSSRQEMADSMNNVQGSYSYIGDDQMKRVVNYKAGGDIGFVVSGQHLPQQVKDTADVEAAKAAFRAAYEAALAGSGQSSHSSAGVAMSYGAPVSASISFMPVHMNTASASADDHAEEPVEMSHQMSVVPTHHTLHHVQHAGDNGVITYSLQDGVVVMQADGISSPRKFGYTFN